MKAIIFHPIIIKKLQYQRKNTQIIKKTLKKIYFRGKKLIIA